MCFLIFVCETLLGCISLQYVTTMGDSQLSPPLAVKTPYNKTDLDEFRDSLGEPNYI